LFSPQGHPLIAELIRREATITIVVEGVATQEAAGAGAGAGFASLEPGDNDGPELDSGAGDGVDEDGGFAGVGLDGDGDLAGVGEATGWYDGEGVLASGDGDFNGTGDGPGDLVRDSGECAGAGGLAYGDGDGDFEGTGDICGVLVTGDGPGAPVGALLLGALAIGDGDTGDTDGTWDEVGGLAIGAEDLDGAWAGLWPSGDGALGDIAGGYAGVEVCFVLTASTTTISFCPFGQLSSFPLMKKKGPDLSNWNTEEPESIVLRGFFVLQLL